MRGRRSSDGWLTNPMPLPINTSGSETRSRGFRLFESSSGPTGRNLTPHGRGLLSTGRGLNVLGVWGLNESLGRWGIEKEGI